MTAKDRINRCCLKLVSREVLRPELWPVLIIATRNLSHVRHSEFYSELDSSSFQSNHNYGYK